MLLSEPARLRFLAFVNKEPLPDVEFPVLADAPRLNLVRQVLNTCQVVAMPTVVGLMDLPIQQTVDALNEQGLRRTDGRRYTQTCVRRMRGKAHKWEAA